MERDAVLLLLNEQHSFPGLFQFRAIVHPSQKGQVVAAVVAATGNKNALSDVHEKASSKGKYVALRIALTVVGAEQVLSIYSLLSKHPGVVTSL